MNSFIANVITGLVVIGILFLLTLEYCENVQAYEGLAEPAPELKPVKVEC